MAERDLTGMRERAVQRLGEIGAAACNAAGVEAALQHVTGAVFDLLGDRQARHRAGALKPGERQFFVAGVFLVTPTADSHLLVAERGFPPEQHRLRIPIDTGHPGLVYRRQRPTLLANTDEHADFRQILQTARMGSAMFGPMFWRGQMAGQLIMAAQARHTFEPADLDMLAAFASLAAALYAAHDGAAWLQSLL